MAEITIYDIAREAGVSPATVSRVLTNNARVSEKRRNIIEKIIHKYNYRPNAAAQSLTGGSRVIGLMVADIRNSYYASIAIECEIAAKLKGYTVLLCNMLENRALEDDLLEKLYAQRAEAIIQIGRRTDDLVSDPEYVEHVRRIGRSIPFITSGKLDGVDFYSVRINHTHSMKLVMDYLVSLGHRNIAFLGGLNFVLPSHEMWEQYILSMREHGLIYRDEFFYEGDYTNEAGYNYMERMLKAKTLPTAVMAVNEEGAMGIAIALQEHRLSVPGDISIVGFGNTHISTLFRPSLTAVDYDYP
ncbi:MAG: LacI family transcriptional regulator, partial [Treponema sp.]|nr:LacI family transcriptional regulator [Treponema sp.]